MTEKRLDLIDALEQVLNDVEKSTTVGHELSDSIWYLKTVFADIGIKDSLVRSMGYGKLISLALEKTA